MAILRLATTWSSAGNPFSFSEHLTCLPFRLSFGRWSGGQLANPDVRMYIYSYIYIALRSCCFMWASPGHWFRLLPLTVVRLILQPLHLLVGLPYVCYLKCSSNNWM